MSFCKWEKTYIAIDLKSFYASVECVERGLDPLDCNLVVADASRTEKTICLAVTPALKARGISGRARLFEVISKVRSINTDRKRALRGRSFKGESCSDSALRADSSLKLDYITAVPRMALYMDYSSRIYNIYLKYAAPEDIHVYSVDEVFIDVTHYLSLYQMTPHELTMTMIRDVLKETGITATAGIAPNLYLCKVAMDIVAKHVDADKDGVRIAELDERSYRALLWDHRPLTDFWRVGRGYIKKLEAKGLFTMGDIARCSLGSENDYYNEDLLFDMFGINAELLIDHAWGVEPCTMADIKAYRPSSSSLGSGQVLPCPYDNKKARVIVKEMADDLSLSLLDKQLAGDQVVLDVGFDIESAKDKNYKGELSSDYLGRTVPRHAHGSCNLSRYTSSSKLITEAALKIFDENVDPGLLVRRISITVNHVITRSEAEKKEKQGFVQLDVFSYKNYEKEKELEDERLKKEESARQAMLDIKKKYGKNAIVRGINLEEGARGIERNSQVGGHRA